MALSRRYDLLSRYPFGDSWFDRPLRIFDQNFGTGLYDDDLLIQPPSSCWSSGLPRMGSGLAQVEEKSGISEIQYDKDKYQVILDVQHFKPDEITVKTIADTITVHGHHEEKQDEHGFISRSFTRRYVLPEDVKIDHVECNLSTDGILTLKAPRVIALKDDTERQIPIMQTGKRAIKQQESPPLPLQEPLALEPQPAVAPPETPDSEERRSCGDEMRKFGSGSA